MTVWHLNFMCLALERNLILHKNLGRCWNNYWRDSKYPEKLPYSINYIVISSIVCFTKSMNLEFFSEKQWEEGLNPPDFSPTPTCTCIGKEWWQVGSFCFKLLLFKRNQTLLFNWLLDYNSKHHSSMNGDYSYRSVPDLLFLRKSLMWGRHRSICSRDHSQA